MGYYPEALNQNTIPHGLSKVKYIQKRNTFVNIYTAVLKKTVPGSECRSSSHIITKQDEVVRFVSNY